MAGLFQVLWGIVDGKFQKADSLKGTDEKELIIPVSGREEMAKNICTRPWAVDWDFDGDLDLLVGNFEGTFYLFTGEGNGQFSPEPEAVKSGAEDLQIHGVHSDPTMVDWDGDGDLDLLSGSSEGGVQWAENSAGEGNLPVLSSFVSLIEGVERRNSDGLVGVEDLKKPSRSSRVWVSDLNNDGKLDLLVGDNTTLAEPVEGLSIEEFQKKQSDWEAEMAEVSSQMSNPKNQEEIQNRFRDLYFAKSEFINEERTGFVWAYLRK